MKLSWLVTFFEVALSQILDFGPQFNAIGFLFWTKLAIFQVLQFQECYLNFEKGAITFQILHFWQFNSLGSLVMFASFYA